MAKQVAIAIDLLFVEKPIVRFNSMIKKILKRFKAIKNKISVYTEAIPPLKAGKSWAQVAALVLAKYVLRAKKRMMIIGVMIRW